MQAIPTFNIHLPPVIDPFKYELQLLFRAPPNTLHGGTGSHNHPNNKERDNRPLNDDEKTKLYAHALATANIQAKATNLHKELTADITNLTAGICPTHIKVTASGYQPDNETRQTFIRNTKLQLFYEAINHKITTFTTVNNKLTTTIEDISNLILHLNPLHINAIDNPLGLKYSSSRHLIYPENPCYIYWYDSFRSIKQEFNDKREQQENRKTKEQNRRANLQQQQLEKARHKIFRNDIPEDPNEAINRLLLHITRTTTTTKERQPRSILRDNRNKHHRPSHSHSRPHSNTKSRPHSRTYSRPHSRSNSRSHSRSRPLSHSHSRSRSHSRTRSCSRTTTHQNRTSYNYSPTPPNNKNRQKQVKFNTPKPPRHFQRGRGNQRRI